MADGVNPDGRQAKLTELDSQAERQMQNVNSTRSSNGEKGYADLYESVDTKRERKDAKGAERDYQRARDAYAKVVTPVLGKQSKDERDALDAAHRALIGRVLTGKLYEGAVSRLGDDRVKTREIALAALAPLPPVRQILGSELEASGPAQPGPSGPPGQSLPSFSDGFGSRGDGPSASAQGPLPSVREILANQAGPPPGREPAASHQHGAPPRTGSPGNQGNQAKAPRR